jgi:hypothetical protein
MTCALGIGDERVDLMCWNPTDARERQSQLGQLLLSFSRDSGESETKNLAGSPTSLPGLVKSERFERPAVCVV